MTKLNAKIEKAVVDFNIFVIRLSCELPKKTGRTGFVAVSAKSDAKNSRFLAKKPIIVA
jgi:hypothetical protein